MDIHAANMHVFILVLILDYRQVSNLRRTLVGN